MGTDVGSLNASLTLDLSGFRAGMAEAASLANELSGQLQSIFSGDGFMGMALDVIDLVQQIELLRGSVESFNASMQSMSGADAFAQMRTHTAALPSEINQISSAIASIDFTQANTQLATMQGTVATLVGQIQQLANVDLSTAEVLGDGSEELSAFYYLQNNIEAINESLSQTPLLLQECSAAAMDWLTSMEQISGSTDNIVNRLLEATQALRAARTQSTGARQDAGKANKEVQKMSKNLQTTKGYAVSLKGILGGIVISQSFYQLLNTMEELVNGAAKFSKNMQDAGVAFSYLMQDSTVSSEAFLNALKDIALRSPLDTTDLTAASRKLMAMGFSAEATVPALQILTDTAAVFSNSAGDMSSMIDHISLAFGQMIASGKVSAQELRQLYNAGLPIYELLSEGLGITMEQAKNIGKQNVDSATAVYAVLDQLQQRYSGASEALAQTFSGAMEVIKESMEQLLSYSWAGIFDTLTQKVNYLAKYLQALVKITQAYGPGGLFQAIFPEAGWDTLRRFIAGIQQIGAALKNFFAVVGTYFGGGIKLLVQLGSYVLPILGNIANVLTYVARAALKASPALRFLLSVLAAFVIGSVVYSILARVVRVIWMLTGAAKAAAAIKTLISSFVGLIASGNVVTIGLLAVAAAFLAIVAASEKARAAISGFFKGIGTKVNNFAQSLGLGFDLDSIEMPEFSSPDTADFSEGLQDLIDGMEDLGDATEESGKKAKKATQSFDEVFTIDDSDSGDASDGLSDLASELAKIGDLNYDNLFDWTGDWATDWGNLSAGIGDLGDNLSDISSGISEWASNFWGNLADALGENPEFAGSLLATAIGAVLGGILGGKPGAIIGAAIGLLTSELADAIWKSLQAEFGYSDKAGKVISFNSLAQGIITGLSTAIGLVIKFLQAPGATLSFKDVGVALKTGLKNGIIGALGNIALSFIGEWIVGSIGEAVGKSAGEIEAAGDWAAWGATFLGTIGSILGTIIAPGIGTLIGGWLGTLAGTLASGLGSLFSDEIVAWAEMIVDYWTNFFTVTLPNLWHRFTQWFSGVWAAFSAPFAKLWESIKKPFEDLWEDIQRALLTKDWARLGLSIIEGIFTPFFELPGIISRAVLTFFNGLWNAFKEIFGIHSPAKEMEPIGENILKGVLEGILTIVSTISTWLKDNVFTPIHNWFTEHLSVTKFTDFGSNLIKGVREGASNTIAGIGTWMTTNVFTPIKTWFDNNFKISTFLDYGKNVVQGLINGITDKAKNLWTTVTTTAGTVKEAIADKLQIRSPSRVTMAQGGYIIEGLIKGVQSKTQALHETISHLTDGIIEDFDTSNVEIDPSITTDFAATSALDNLSTWSVTFVGIITDTFNSIADLFDNLSVRIQGATDSLSNIQTSSIGRASTALNNTMGTLVADGAPMDSSSTGTLAGQIMADLTEATLDKLSERLAARIYEYLAPLFATLNADDQDRILAYVGTLIADDAGLRDLERKLKIIQISEGRRS